MWEIYPSDENMIIEDYKKSGEDEEDAGFVLPEDQRKEMELDEDGIYKVKGVGDDVEFVEEGDVVAIPNRTIGRFDLPGGTEVKYAHKDRVVAKVVERD